MTGEIETIKLDGETVWIRFEIGGHSFETEIFEAVELLRAIDERHAGALNHCTSCGVDFQTPDDGSFDGSLESLSCPKCRTAGAMIEDGQRRVKIVPDQSYLDDVSALIRDRYGAPRCSRTEAAVFYQAIVDRVSAAKKNG